MAVIIYLFFWSLKAALIQIDCPFISFQLFILLICIIDIRSYTLPFNMDFFTLFSSFQVINFCFVSFFIDAGNIRTRGVILYETFLYLFSMFKILQTSISICIGFIAPTTSKFYCARITIVSIN